MKLAEQLIEARQHFPTITRDRINTHFGSSYVSLDAILNAVMTPLGAAGLLVTQHVETTETMAVLTTRITNGDGETIFNSVPVCATFANAQAFGSALTYARRQSLSTLLCLAIDDDDDANTATEHPERKQTPKAAVEPTQAVFEVPETVSDHPAGEVVIHFGKNKGRRVAELSLRSLQWYVSEWQLNPNPRTGEVNPADKALKKAVGDFLNRNPIQTSPDDDIPF